MAYHMLLMLSIQVCVTDNKLSIWDVWCVPLYFLSSKGSFLKFICCDQETRIKTFCNLSWRYYKQESETWYLYRKLLCDRKYIVWSWMIRSITIEISWRSEVLWVSFEKGLIFVTLHLSGKGASLMERLGILAIGAQSVFELLLRNLPARLSNPMALLVSNLFNIFRIDTELTFSKLS